MSEEKPLTKYAETLQLVAKPLINAITFLLPHAIEYTKKSYAFYKTLPHDVITFITGFIFCFFGGLYPTLFAAIQAAEHGGRKVVMESLKDLSDEAMVILEASKKDDEVDADNDGKADVDQIDGKELILRKTKLVLAKMNPEKVDKAISAMYSVWMSVLAVLTIQFARTISMALTISDFLKRPCDHVLEPTLNAVTPDEYERWIPIVLGWIRKSISMSIAWYIQTIISAFTSALAGGLMMARALLKICVRKGFTLGGIVPERDEDTYFDEVASYVFAGVGFYIQFKLGFAAPFPLNLILFPFEIAEYYIRWTITKVH